MGDFFKNIGDSLDTRKKRRIFRIAEKVQRISIVILVWLAGMSLLYGIYMLAFIQPYFKVEDIEIKGSLNVLSPEDVVEQSGINVGDLLLRISVKDVQKRLSENPWIKESAVHRKFPNMVWIYVNEYSPEAIVKLDNLYYVDRLGNQFKKVSVKDNKDFPVITGLEEFEFSASSDEFKSKVVEALLVRDLFEKSSIYEGYGLSEIHISPTKGFSIITMDNPLELRLGFGPFNEKLNRLEMVHSAIRSHGGVALYIDLRPEGKVFVKYGA